MENKRLRIELAQIEGGGEGVLLALWALARRFSQLNQLDAIRGFVIANLPNIGEAY